MMMKKKLLVPALIAGGLVSPLAHATNGYFAIGYGQENEAMGGVGIALPLNSIAAATNPAGMVMIGNRADLGLILFKPNRDATVTGSPAFKNGNFDGNGRSNFLIPQAGYNHMLNNDMSVGVSIFGNGGMNTQYNNNLFNGAGPAGINLSQLFIAPTWAMKINPTNAIGVSLNLVYQMFSAQGLQAFGPSSSNAAALTNNGTDTSTGIGIRLGWTGEITPMVTLGATYQPKTKMSKFSKYAGLFADQGSFDIPASYGAGVAVKANSETTVAFDIEQIQYAGVTSVGNSPNIAAPFGSSNGPGFGWSNMTVFKLGTSYAVDKTLTLRGGLNHNTQQIGASSAFINILAPGVVQNHLTLGATWTLADKSTVSLAFVHAFSQSVTGNIPTAFGGGTATIKMHEDSIGVSYGW